MAEPTGLNNERVGRGNLAVVLNEVHTRGAVSRSELAATTGLYRQTIGALVRQLKQRGLVTEERVRSSGARGRPSLVVRARTDSILVLVIDIEVDSLGLGLFGLGGTMLRSRRRPWTCRVSDPEETINEIANTASRFLTGRDRSRLVAISVAIVGLVRHTDGLVRTAPDLGWIDVPLAELLSTRLGIDVPVRVGNEADLGAFAEHLRGAATGEADVLYLSGEIGIGGGLIIGGKLMAGADGYAGEMGHMVVNSNGIRCRCGAVGCWDTEVGEGALMRRAGRHRTRQRDRAAAEIIAQATAGDPKAVEAVLMSGRWLGIGLASLVNVFNPRMVVLGGLHGRMYPLIEGVVLQELESRASAAAREHLTVRTGNLGVDAPLLGAGEVGLAIVLGDLTRIPTQRAVRRKTR